MCGESRSPTSLIQLPASLRSMLTHHHLHSFQKSHFINYSVCCLTPLILFDGRGVFTLLSKVQLHVSALENSHLQAVHETLESSYIQDLIWAVYSGDVGNEVGTRSRTCHGGWWGGYMG